MIENYAFINNNTITNIAVFEDVTAETLEHFRIHHNADEVLLADPSWGIGYTHDGTTFVAPVVEEITEEAVVEQPAIEEPVTE